MLHAINIQNNALSVQIVQSIHYNILWIFSLVGNNCVNYQKNAEITVKNIIQTQNVLIVKIDIQPMN